MIFMNPQGFSKIRQTFSYVLIGVGVTLLLFPKFIGTLLTLLGCIFLSEKATARFFKFCQDMLKRAQGKL